MGADRLALALTAPHIRTAALIGSLALIALLVGYVVAQHVRSYSVGANLIVFWGVVALLVGPLLGVAASWVREREGVRAALGAGAICGVLIGEGVYGLTRSLIRPTPPYWWGEVVVGLSLGVIALARAPRTLLSAGVGGLHSSRDGGRLCRLYSQDLVAVLP